MEDFSLHILDIAENSIDAGASNIQIKISIREPDDRLILSIEDNGKGMDEETLKKVRDPFFTTKTAIRCGRKFGLGIPLLAQAARECSGTFTIASELGKGTVINAQFSLSHIDIKPLGDIGATMVVLISGHPEIDFSLIYEKNGFSYTFDTRQLKAELNGVPINLPDVLKLIKDDINEAITQAY